METKVKVLVIGPQRCGKTRIANFISDFDESPNFEIYNATAGVRILEFERQVKGNNGRQFKISVEMWDCSGDKKYENCWGAILRQAQGVVMVYDPSIKTQEKDIELWHKAFVQPLKLKPEQVCLYAHQHDAVGSKQWQAPRALERFAFVNSTLDSEEGTTALRKSFDKFLGGLAVAASEKAKSDLDASLQVAER